jgi:hypothetical protein
LIIDYCCIATFTYPLPDQPTYEGGWDAIGVAIEARDVYEGFSILAPLTGQAWIDVQTPRTTQRCAPRSTEPYDMKKALGKPKSSSSRREYDPAVSKHIGEAFFGVAGGREYNHAD